MAFKRMLCCDRCSRPWLGKRGKTDNDTWVLARRGGWQRHPAEGEGTPGTTIDACSMCVEALTRLARLEGKTT